MRNNILKAAVVGAVLSSALTACSSPAPPVGTATPTPVPASPPPQVSPPKAIPNEPGQRKNVKQTSCAAVPGGWAAEGTAANRGTTPVTYSITVFFTTTAATVLDFAKTEVSVKPGEVAKWKASKNFEAPDKVLCPMPGITASRAQ
ncbi:hypothetical protein DQ384_17405 [Sphaerisporangium album]|uniref:CBM2 domain-containing protein n=1 Tax=Sphaerisporangium album TaxID=509200 RepID=A0A367FJX2_9ACTN|nr:hypothetical protein [Sphaerisporangium album]RCG29940.1 hypothetical protein DQ384_17405 [Sphaerisporangium album]